MDTDQVSGKWDATKGACPTRQVLGRIGDTWTMLVISTLEAQGTLRSGQLKSAIEGITQKMLTQSLRHLERDGVVRRDVVPTVPVTVTYTLTPLGLSLGLAVATMRTWAYQHMDEIVAARNEYDEARET
ncbi:helix-turn-helix transcriptional regulator [Kribbella qitaiheensis]|uniref:Helix-turn-helix transcriptional regulator n=1 Tax=Kribbella qitaiheensis TaxID=1544730 RepID=A0A7G6X6F0_9ACTN|nr:helix-turn-helix domain-containing protein [Kribbella qitaiheensis]QNE21815.1 helix-turn-helix transcriptional regulator [Kribbella qitaiheensis]